MIVSMTLQGALRRYYTVFFLRHFSASLPTGVVVLYMLARGLTLQNVGLIFAVLSITIILLEVPTGGLADAVGRKKVALAGYLFGFASILVLLIAPNFSIMLLHPILMGIGLSLGSGSLEAWFIDKIEKDNPGIDLQPYLAKQDTVDTVASALGAIIGGAIPFVAIVSGLTTIEPLSLPIMAGLVVRAVSIIALITLIPNDVPSQNSSYNPATKLQTIFKSAFRLVSRQTQLQRLLLVSFINGMGHGAVEAFWQPHFQTTLGLSSQNTFSFGLIMAAGFLCGMVGSVYATKFVNLLNAHSLASLSAQIFKALCLFLLAGSGNFYLTAVAFGLFYATLMLNMSPHATLYNQRIPSENRSTLLSVSSLVLYLGVGLGTTIFGYLAQHSGFGIGFLFLAIPTFLSAFIYLGIESRSTTATSVA
jgi:MFS transporter, DHA1 family, quinolone resistance protein